MRANRLDPLHPAVLLAGLLLLLAAALPVRGDEALWQRLASGGHVMMMRHALAPGTGDPAEFELGDCSTQRNLSDEGRAQARRIGALLRERGVPVQRVLTSQWCRCEETARLLDVGTPEAAPMLDSFFRDPSTRDAQTERTRAWIAAWQPRGGNLLLVTHQVNISAISGRFAESGGIVVLARDGAGGLVPVGSIATQ